MDVNSEFDAETFMCAANVSEIRHALGQGGTILTDRFYDEIWNAGEFFSSYYYHFAYCSFKIDYSLSLTACRSCVIKLGLPSCLL